MKQEDKKTLFICFAMIILLMFFSFWKTKSLSDFEYEKPRLNFPEIDISSFSLDQASLEEAFSGKNHNSIIDNSSFIYIEKKISDSLSFSVPSNWIVIESFLGLNEDILETKLLMTSPAINNPSIIGVFRLNEKIKDKNEAISEIRKVLSAHGVAVKDEMLIDSINGLTISSVYHYDNINIKIDAEERLIFDNDNFYFIMALKGNDNDLDFIRTIIDSVKIKKLL